MHINISFILANKRDDIVTTHAIKTHGSSGCIAPLILKVGTLLHSRFNISPMAPGTH